MGAKIKLTAQVGNGNGQKVSESKVKVEAEQGQTKGSALLRKPTVQLTAHIYTDANGNPRRQ